jgi:sodium/potassium-transporting ATPase subunit alpha
MEIWHKVALNELFAKLDSSQNGLHDDEVLRRQKQYGPNFINKEIRMSGLIRFLKHTTNFFALLLLMGALLATIAEIVDPGQGNIFIGVALVIVVLLNALFSFYQETRVEQAMKAFKKLMPEKAKVIRNGKEYSIIASEVVPGDIIIIDEGDMIPADARLIEANSLKVDNSSLTGESEPQLRCLEMTHDNILESRNMVFSSTIVLSGDGKAVVYATGMNSQIGKVAGLTQTIETTPTPIHKQLQHFIRVISTFAIALGIFFFILGFFFDRGFMQNMIFAIGIIVANVPEGLLPTVTLALSISAQKMAKKNALIKTLESVETLGSTTVICTDKTGTITVNKMSVCSVFLGEGLIDIKKISDQNDRRSADIHKLLHACVLCNNSNISIEDGKADYIGDPTDGALLMFAREHVDIDKLRSTIPRLHEEPFDSKTKRMISVNHYLSGKYAYMKGAPEVVLKKCKNVLINGRQLKLDSAYLKIVQKQCENFSKKGERVLAFAYKKLDAKSKSYDVHDGYILIGILSMLDPPRHDVPEAVAKCQKAGIRVIMITGDHPKTAESIARQVGIIKTLNPRIITGEELNSMKHDALLHVLKEGEVLFARTSPHQKLRIVKALQEHGEIVAVTGDGVNDAPALKHADIGVAMGSGTDVAKEAANMILADDNFATIVNAIEEGRTIYENIKNFIAYILTHITPEIMPFIAFALFGIPFALTVLLILLIDLGTDMVPALGLATEKSESDVMEQKPRKRDEKLLTKGMIIRSYLIFGMIETAAGFFSYFYILYAGGWTYGVALLPTDPLYMKAVTAFFVSIIITQIANVMICRVRRRSVFEKGLFSNRFVLIGIAVELILTIFIVYSHFAHTFLNTASLSVFEFFLAVPFALLIFFGDELRRYYVRNNDWAREHMSF